MQTNKERTSFRPFTEEELYFAISSNSNDDFRKKGVYYFGDSDEDDSFDEASDGEDENDNNFESICLSENEGPEDGAVYLINGCTIDKTEKKYDPLGVQSGKSTRLIDVQIDCIYDSFRLLFDDEIIDNLVRCTNTEASEKDAEWKNVTRTEMLAYIGLLIAAGANDFSRPNYRLYFNRLFGMPLFLATMNLERFKSLLKYIRFDEKSSRAVRRNTDKLAPIRDIFNLFRQNLKKYYAPSENLTISGQLIHFNEKCPFKYMSGSPDECGLRLFWLCDADTQYPLDGSVYLGKIFN